MGMGIVPDERRRLGLNMLFDIKDNTTLPNLDHSAALGIFQIWRRRRGRPLTSTKR